MTDETWARVPIEPQTVAAPLSRSAVFLTLTIAGHPDAAATVRNVLGDIGGLVKTVGFRDLAGHLSCVVGIGADAWQAVTGLPRPSQLRPFVTVKGGRHTAVSTPGDLFFHIRAERDDLCFEFERLLLNALGEAVEVADETVGFRYFDSRDLLGFVDGTANPTGSSTTHWSLVGDEEPEHSGGSYLMVQKYLHDVTAWGALSTDQQEAIIGRTKADNVELDDAPTGQKAHKTLATLTDANGVEHDILRDNMPFGRPGHGEFGTYFIAYSRDYWVTEQMLRTMYIGDPVGSYDRILDFSTAVTGAAFFVPSNDVLGSFGD